MKVACGERGIPSKIMVVKNVVLSLLLFFVTQSSNAAGKNFNQIRQTWKENFGNLHLLSSNQTI